MPVNVGERTQEADEGQQLKAQHNQAMAALEGTPTNEDYRQIILLLMRAAKYHERRISDLERGG